MSVKQHEEEQRRSYEEQSVLALEDRKSALLRAMTSSGESVAMRIFHLSL